MTERFPNVRRGLGVFALMLGLLGSGFVYTSIASTTPVNAEGITITVPVVTPAPTPAPTTEAPVVVPVGASVSEAEFDIALVGLEPFSFVEVYANSEPVLVASGYADGYGAFSAIVKLPPNLPAGDHSISALTVAADGTTKTITIVEFAVLADGKLAKAGSTGGGIRVPNVVVDEGTVTEEEADTFLASNPLNLSGVFYVGAFESSATYDDGGFLNPGARLSMYINNVHTTNATGIVRFWVSNPLGFVIAESKPYSIRPLAPGETRFVSSRFTEIGQWGGYTTHLSFTPDKAVRAGIDTPYLRSDALLVFSWVVTTLALLGAGAFVLASFPALRERILEAMRARFREVNR